MVRALGSGDRVRGAKIQTAATWFLPFAFYYFSFFLSLPTVCTLSLTLLVGTYLSMFYKLSQGGKREEPQKSPSSAIWVANTDKSDVWERKTKTGPQL